MLLRITLLALFGAGCSSSPSGAGALPEDPAQAFATIEARLLAAPTILCVSRISAEGALTADLVCSHALGEGGRARIQASGTFEGRPVELSLVCDGQRMLLSTPEGTQELAAPRELRAGLVLGFTRMGWLHNLARLSQGQAPDATDGSIETFTRPLDLAGGEPLSVDGRPRRTLTFGVEVGGEPRALAVLWVDCENGLPIERWQRVRFPDGEMRVVEAYDRIALGAELGALAVEPGGQ